MQKDWMKSTATYTFTEKDHKNGVRHSFSYISKDVTADAIAQLGAIIDSFTEGALLDATVSTTEHVGSQAEAPAKPEEPKA